MVRTCVLVWWKLQDDTLPADSHMLLFGLADGRFLWESLHNSYHPLGWLNHDIRYPLFYEFLSCLGVSHFHCLYIPIFGVFGEVWTRTVFYVVVSSSFSSVNSIVNDFVQSCITCHCHYSVKCICDITCILMWHYQCLNMIAMIMNLWQCL